MAQFKNNLQELGESLDFRLDFKEDSEIPAMIFETVVDITADELLGASKKTSPIVKKIKPILMKILKDRGGKAPAKEIKEILHKEGYKDGSINKAKKALGIESKAEKVRSIIIIGY